MFEKVNPAHPDKLADRIAGALVDMAYSLQDNPKIAVEVLLGHGDCNIIAETSVNLDRKAVYAAVERITGHKNVNVFYREIPQDARLAANQSGMLRCGDNGIFRGVPTSKEQRELARIARDLYLEYGTDGKYILDQNHLIVCQSHMQGECRVPLDEYHAQVNPLGYWTGGIDVDCGATNRKLGSDMGDAVTGGGLHGKDLSKADVSVNIYAHILASQLEEPVEMRCAIGDEFIDGTPYRRIVEVAKDYIAEKGGFEKFAEWGLID